MKYGFTCAGCSRQFDRAYSVNVRRAQRPQYCSKECLSARPMDGNKNRCPAPKSIEMIRDRFWSRVAIGAPDQCWPWRGRVDPNGYGRFDYRDRPYVSHRIAFMLSRGEPGTLSVCHSCDNPPCCNPAHLWLGAQTDNNRDRDTKGRLKPGKPPQGSKSNLAKLSEAAALEIFHSKDNGPILGRKFGVTRDAIYRIKKGQTWRWLTGGANAP